MAAAVLIGSLLVAAASCARRRRAAATWPGGPSGSRARVSYWCATSVAAVGNLVVAVTFFLVPQVSVALHRADAGEVALVLLPGLAAGLAGNVVTNGLRRRWGDPVVTACGLGVLAACFAVAAAHPESPTLSWLAAWVAIEGLGVSLVLLTVVDVSLGCSALSLVPSRIAAVTQTWRQMGAAAGVAFCAAAIVRHSPPSGPAVGPVSTTSLVEATQTVVTMLLVLSLGGIGYVLLALRTPEQPRSPRLDPPLRNRPTKEIDT